jgi:hypothetical protein
VSYPPCPKPKSSKARSEPLFVPLFTEARRR